MPGAQRKVEYSTRSASVSRRSGPRNMEPLPRSTLVMLEVVTLREGVFLATDMPTMKGIDAGSIARVLEGCKHADSPMGRSAKADCPLSPESGRTSIYLLALSASHDLSDKNVDHPKEAACQLTIMPPRGAYSRNHSLDKTARLRHPGLYLHPTHDYMAG